MPPVDPAAVATSVAVAAPRRRSPADAALVAPSPRPLCHAPFSSLYFDPRGKLRACCQTRGEQLGDIRHRTIREVWDGARVAAMRTELDAGSYPEACAFCAWQVSEGDEHVLFARGFDDLEVDRVPEWPRQLELALTNTCNLQCVMCSGDFSSAIRSRREGRPPLPEVYGEAFFVELAEFLPHAEQVQFYGGEPLLGREPMRVLEMIAALPDPPKVTMTTNATIWNPRVERVLETIKPWIVVSLDGATAETFDAIRVGAHLPDVLANVERYRELVGSERVSLTTCLMTSNWHEFPALIELAARWDTHLGVNVLHHPPERSLYQLAPERLAAVVDALAEAEVPAERRHLLDEQVMALRNRLEWLRGRADDERGDHHLPIAPFYRPGGTSRWGWLPFPETSDATGPAVEPPAPDPGLDVAVGTDGVLTVTEESGSLADRVASGGPVEEMFDAMAAAGIPVEAWTSAEPVPEPDHHRFTARGRNGLVAIDIYARRDREGALTGARYRFAPAGEPSVAS